MNYLQLVFSFSLGMSGYDLESEKYLETAEFT